MITDCVGLWTKAIPEPKMKLGLFVSLVPLCLWYQGFLDQKVAREARRSLNSHIGKVAKLLQVTVILHPHLETHEKWFHQLREDPIMLSELGYNLFLQDMCLTVVTKLQFNPIEEQCLVAVQYWYQAALLEPDWAPTSRHRKKKKNKHKPF